MGPSIPAARARRPARRTVVAAALITVLAAVALPAPAAADTDDHERVVDITFPVAGDTTYVNDYHQDRGGGSRKHQATDIMAPHGRPVHAAMGGTVSWITGLDGPPPSYGYMISVRGDDGLTYHYIHLGRQNGPPSEAYVAGLARGSRVERGEHIGFVGSSGNAHPDWPHLHFEIFDPALSDPRIASRPYEQGYLNPYFSLRAAEARGDVPGAVAAVDSCGVPDGASYGSVARVYGADRYATAAAVATERFGSATEAVLATGSGYADALAGAALAAAREAPLLLTRPGRLPDATADALTALDVQRVWLLGGERAIAADVERAVGGLVADVRRLAGADRFGTAALVAGRVGAPDGEVVVASGRGFADALAAGALAAGPRPVPLLLVEPDRVPASTFQALAELGADTVTLLGGEQAVSAGVERVLAEAAAVARLAGPDRYATSARVATAAQGRVGANPAALIAASGADFPDALPAGALAAQEGGVLVLLPPCDLNTGPAIRDHVRGQRDGYGAASIIGGPRAVSDRVRAQLAEALDG